MSLYEMQAARLDEILPWARTVGDLHASGVWRPAEQMVHLRPSSTGIRLVDLDPRRPQLDCGKIHNHEGAAERFLQLLQQKPENTPERDTPEKRLQSWLLSEAYQHERQIIPLAPGLILVTDEQNLPATPQDFVCDLLAVHDTAPVVIELKSAREMKRLIQQLDAAAEVGSVLMLGAFDQGFLAVRRTDALEVRPYRVRLPGSSRSGFQRSMFVSETRGHANRPRSHGVRPSHQQLG